VGGVESREQRPQSGFSKALDASLSKPFIKGLVCSDTNGLLIAGTNLSCCVVLSSLAGPISQADQHYHLLSTIRIIIICVFVQHGAS
jgi:hypothetical protein